MDISDYRQRVLAELDAQAQQQTSFRDLVSRSAAPAAPHHVGPAGDEEELNAALQVLQDASGDLQLRLAALQVVSLEVPERPELLDRVLDVFRDQGAPTDLRLRALSVLEQSGFIMIGGGARRPDYLEALRTVVDDPNSEVRRRAIGVLARQKDEYAQRRLLEGLQDPSKALIPPAKAVQYLGYDVHAEYFPLLRQIVANPPDEESRREAVRLLSADPGSKDLLVQLLRDKNEYREVRNLSALGLQSIDPGEFEQQARGIVLDDDDYDDIRSTAVTALTHFADPNALRKDDELRQQVQQLREKSTSPDLKQASEDLYTKLGAQE